MNKNQFSTKSPFLKTLLYTSLFTTVFASSGHAARVNIDEWHHCGKKVDIKTTHNNYLKATNDLNKLNVSDSKSDSTKFIIKCFGGSENKIALKTSKGKYVVATGYDIKANRDRVGGWEKFEVYNGKQNNTYALYSHRNAYIVAEKDGTIQANRTRIGGWESFKIEPDGTPTNNGEGEGNVNFQFDISQNNGDLGVEIKPREYIGGSSADIILHIKKGNGSYAHVRTEGAAPYEWGTKNRNKTDSKLLNLEGNYTLKATVVSGSFIGKVATKNVSVDGSSDNSDNRGNLKNLPDFDYTALQRERNKDVTMNFATKGAKYLLIIKSGGRDVKPAKTSFFDTTGYNRIIGTVGSKDKGMMLIDVKGKNSVRITRNNSAKQVLRIYTDKNMEVLNDNRGGKNLNGALDPSLGGKKVTKDRNAFMTFYADDEGGKGNRDDDFGNISVKGFGKGDDLLWIITGNKTSSSKGNGAIMHVK
jgi:hypothetical protein